MNIENLKALVYGKETTPYQRALALSEFSKVVKALEKPTYTPTDMEALMNWMAENAFPSELKGYWILNGTGEEVTTAQLREIWEMETGRKEEAE